MCYIYKFWWNSVSKYIGLYLAITSYSTRFNISHSLLSHDHYIKQNIRHKLTSGLYCKWYCTRTNLWFHGSKMNPTYIHSLMVMPISLTVCQWNKLQNKQAYIFFCERSLPEKETFWFADERRSIKDCSLKHLQPKEKGKCVSRSFKEKKHLYIL